MYLALLPRVPSSSKWFQKWHNALVIEVKKGINLTKYGFGYLFKHNL
jgi:hypothetical protein